MEFDAASDTAAIRVLVQDRRPDLLGVFDAALDLVVEVLEEIHAEFLHERRRPGTGTAAFSLGESVQVVDRGLLGRVVSAIGFDEDLGEWVHRVEVEDGPGGRVRTYAVPESNLTRVAAPAAPLVQGTETRAQGLARGRDAFLAGLRRVPYHDPVLRSAYTAGPIPTNEFIDGWLRGWDDANIAAAAPETPEAPVPATIPSPFPVLFEDVRVPPGAVARVRRVDLGTVWGRSPTVSESAVAMVEDPWSDEDLPVVYAVGGKHVASDEAALVYLTAKKAAGAVRTPVRVIDALLAASPVSEADLRVLTLIADEAPLPGDLAQPARFGGPSRIDDLIAKGLVLKGPGRLRLSAAGEAAVRARRGGARSAVRGAARGAGKGGTYDDVVAKRAWMRRHDGWLEAMTAGRAYLRERGDEVGEMIGQGFFGSVYETPTGIVKITGDPSDAAAAETVRAAGGLPGVVRIDRVVTIPVPEPRSLYAIYAERLLPIPRGEAARIDEVFNRGMGKRTPRELAEEIRDGRPGDNLLGPGRHLIRPRDPEPVLGAKLVALADTVDALADLGIVVHDLSWENVMQDDHGRWKIVDLGVSEAPEVEVHPRLRAGAGEPPWLPFEQIRPAIAVMVREGVSDVARSPRGFLRAWRHAEGHPGRLGVDKHSGQSWRDRRNAFLARHVAQAEENAEPFWRDGQPTRRHLALAAWAYTPTPERWRRWVQGL